jgi:tetratricopeptide (TPR) repeat protein
MEYGQRMLSLNPYYRYGVLYVAGFLAFNNPVNRPDQALALIAQAVKGDPKYWRYKMVAGAIGYTQDDRSEEAAALLEESIKDPECPSMIKSILAGIHRKAGRYGRAAELYESLLEARDKDYAERARKNLEDMMALGEIRERIPR